MLRSCAPQVRRKIRSEAENFPKGGLISPEGKNVGETNYVWDWPGLQHFAQRVHKLVDLVGALLIGLGVLHAVLQMGGQDLLVHPAEHGVGGQQQTATSKLPLYD